MGEALVGGLLAAGRFPPDSLRVVESDTDRRAALEQAFPAVVVGAAPAAADGHVIAVKPHDVPAATRAVAAFGATRVLSIAAGVTLASLEGDHIR